MISVAVDVGGTFTDVVAGRLSSGHMRTVKVPTSPGRLAECVIEGALEALELLGAETTDVTRFVHGTTVATNALLERDGAIIGLLTTEGFEDVLEIGRTRRLSLYDLDIDAQTPVFLAPRRRRLGVRERLGADGDVVVPLNEAQALEQIDALVAAGVEGVAVCLLHSYRNDAHEQRLGELIRGRAPGLSVSLSSEVDPIFREYERTVVTCFDAYVAPVVRSYLAELGARLREQGVGCPLQVMQSRGGLASVAHAERRPVSLLLSGPAAGVLGAADAARRSGEEELVTLDVGGTSADVAVVDGGRLVTTTEGGIAGFPLRIPLVDVSTIGAGGGSIAWLDATGGLHVGPRSAGAVPGPVAYGRGGAEPTVTDALLVLGFLNPDGLAGGSLALDAEAARSAYETLGIALSLSAEEAAAGVVRVITMRMVDQIRLVSIGRGRDPRESALVALGGAGPVFASAVAAELGIARVIVPSVPGVLSALGLLGAPVEHDQAGTVAMRVDDAEPGELASLADELEQRVASLMEEEGLGETDVVTALTADMRYAGQGATLEVGIAGRFDGSTLAAAGRSFHDRHLKVHGHAQPAKPVELVNLRVVRSWRPEAVPWALAALGGAAAATRNAWFAGEFRETPVLAREAIDEVVEGPLIVEQPDTTIVVHPGERIEALDDGNLALSVR